MATYKPTGIVGEKQRTVAFVVLYVLIGIVVIGLLAAVFRIWTLADEIKTSQDVQTKTSNIIYGCTTPGEPCYERNQKGIANVQANVSQVSIYAAACSTIPKNRGSITKIQACVLTRIEEDRNNTKLKNKTTEGAIP